jgi:general secretion pathway protein A
MYHEFFGLNEPAFSIAVNPRYLYMSDQHREALAHLLYGIQNGGFVMLTGEVGTGKTTILRCLLEQLPDNTDIAFILNPMASAPELLSIICEELGVSYIDDEVGLKELTDALHHFLLKNHRKGRRTVLIIDEAQLLKVPVLEQIRLLTNLETTTEKLLQIMLIGQPELKKLLARPALRQLSQRITARFHLEPLSLPESQAYIAHRLGVGGMPEHRNPFSGPMVKKIHQFSGGVPRLINILCERLLLGAYAKHKQQIDMEIFNQAVLEVAGTNSQAETALERPSARATLHSALIALLLVIMWLVWRYVPDEPAAAPASSATTSLAAASVAAPLDGSMTSLASGVMPIKTNKPEVKLLAKGERDLAQAQIALAAYLQLGQAVVPKGGPCATGAEQKFSCEKTQIQSWDELKGINRPLIMTLATADKKWVYVILIGLSDNYALLLNGGTEQLVRWSDLASLWTGDVLYMWSRPAEFHGALAMGDQGALVTWLAEHFALLDKQPAPLTRHFFTEKLKTRVELFQTSHNLLPSGEVGVQTLLRLNEALGLDQLLKAIDETRLDIYSRELLPAADPGQN